MISVPGYNKQREILLRQIRSHTLPHAILLHGPDGNGLPLLASQLAMAMMCEQPLQGMYPCGTCSFCRQISSLAHPDIFWIFPTIRSSDEQSFAKFMQPFRNLFFRQPYFTFSDWQEELQTENKQLLIGVDIARQLIHHLSMTSYSGKWKVVIIWCMEKMNQEASNKLLKILEEPDPKTRFICISHQPSELLPTILSRLQQIAFPLLPEEDIMLSLQELSPEWPPEKCNAAARYSEGIIRSAIQWLESQDKENELLELFRQGMRIALKYHPEKAIEWTEFCAGLPREKQKQFLEYALRIIRKCFLVNLGIQELCYLLPAENEFISRFSPYVKTEGVNFWEQTFSEACYNLERNANAKILFMDLLFRCNELLHAGSLSSTDS